MFLSCLLLRYYQDMASDFLKNFMQLDTNFMTYTMKQYNVVAHFHAHTIESYDCLYLRNLVV